MNKTISINIAGFFFNIEEKGYEMLHSYFESIKVNFLNAEERDEIMHDIEARVAELFQAELSASKEVLTLADVEKIISIMGEPNDYRTDDETDSSYQQESSNASEETLNKRLFRDKDNATIGGVCSGLAAYFNLDPVLFKLFFVLLFILGGSGIFIYIIMLFIIPEAKTTAEKLQMRGEKVNIDSIKKQFHDFKDDIKSRANETKVRYKVKNAVDKGLHASHGFARAISKIIGFGLVLGGFFIGFLVVSILIGETGFFPLWGERSSESLTNLMDVLYQTQFQSSITFFSILLVLFIPIIGAIYSGFKLLFEIKSNFKTMGIAVSIIWFLSIGICTITGVQLGMEFREESEVREEIAINSNPDVLNIEINDDKIFSNHVNYDSPFRYSQLVQIDDESIFLGTPSLNIIENESDSIFEIEIVKISRGLSQREAIYKAENIEYKIDVQGNNVNLSPILSIDIADKMRGQEVLVIVKVPAGKSVHFGENIRRMPPIECTECLTIKENKFKNSTWKMENNKLQCIECE